jgi:hypothetical protein
MISEICEFVLVSFWCAENFLIVIIQEVCACESRNMEGQIGTLIEKTNKDLHRVSLEYESQMKQRRGSSNSYPRSTVRPPLLLGEDYGSRIFDEVVNEIDNKLPCGPHQKAAIDAFHATRNGARPLARTGSTVEDSRIRHTVDRAVDDRCNSASRAIDALRDQVLALADEVRQLNRNAASQERRMEALSHDVDDRRGIINSVEAHMSDEKWWMRSVENEIGHLKQDIATKASLAEVKTGLETFRRGSTMSIDAALSPLQAQIKIECCSVMNEVNALRLTMQNHISEQMKEISNSTQAFQRNLIETIKMVVKEEAVLAVEKNSSHGNKEYVRIISQIVATVSRLSIPSHLST